MVLLGCEDAISSLSHLHTSRQSRRSNLWSDYLTKGTSFFLREASSFCCMYFRTKLCILVCSSSILGRCCGISEMDLSLSCSWYKVLMNYIAWLIEIVSSLLGLIICQLRSTIN